MKIALINENSQAQKNKMIYDVLSKVATKYNHETINFGMFNDQDQHSLTYVKAGLLSAILLNCGIVDFVVTGCGTGEGAMLALNAFPKVICGHIVDASDAYMFRQINDGNAVALSFAKGFGWGAELNLEYIFDKLLSCQGGGGYPKERVVPEQQNKKILDEVKSISHTDMPTILKNIDRNFLIETINYDTFKENFFGKSKNKEIEKFLSEILK